LGTPKKIAVDEDPAQAKAMMQEVESSAGDAKFNAKSSAVFEGVARAVGDSASYSRPSILHNATAREAYDRQADKDTQTSQELNLMRRTPS
jgi:hypothetical protein